MRQVVLTCEAPGSTRLRLAGTRKSGTNTRCLLAGGRLQAVGRAASCINEMVGLTDQTLSCAARARVPKPTRRSACTHVSRAMQAARRRRVLILTRRLGRRTEAGPRQLLRRVSPPTATAGKVTLDTVSRW